MPVNENGLNLNETELRLGLPGGAGESKIAGKRGFLQTVDLKLNLHSNDSPPLDLEENLKGSTLPQDSLVSPKDLAKPPAKAQMMGWPPVRSFRKNGMKSGAVQEPEKPATVTAALVKVSIDGAPYLRKVDLKAYRSYRELSDALAKMFNSFFTMGNQGGQPGAQGMIDFMNEGKLMDLLNTSEFVPTYEDKDGDWMLVGDVPWEMFVDSCKRLRLMKGCEAIGLAPRGVEKCKSKS